MSSRLGFDALVGGRTPTLMFGPPLQGDLEASARCALAELSVDARRRVADSFKETIEPNAAGVEGLDDIIKNMWKSDWSPEHSIIDRICTDFGALYCAAFLSVSGLQPVFRSTTELDHVSFWNAASTREYFPFHKVVKALSSCEGESLAQMFADALSDRPAQQGAQADGPASGGSAA